MIRLKYVLAAAAAAVAFSATPANAATCIGNCGTSGADGDVTLSPTGNDTYDWVVTNGGPVGAGRIAGYEEGTTNGSELVSDAFFGAVGSKVEFYFNYVTSDGAGFADYAFAQLIKLNPDNSVASTINLFTARTKPSGAIVPGQELPDVTATLNPGTVTIKNGSGNINGTSQGPVWSPLADSSGDCYDAGCGLTDWVKSTYTIDEAGTYQLRFGVTNALDTALDSGLAFDGLLLDGAVIGDGTSFDNPLLPDNIGPNGEFEFTFQAAPEQVVFIDPLIAVGYEYEVQAGSPNILTALFPVLPGDVDGYDIYTLDDVLIAADVLGGVTYNFGPGGVAGFKLLDIDAILDPTDQDAFVTGLSFNIAGGLTTINVVQTPITLFVPNEQPAIPEPATWAMMILGFGAVGVAARRRKRAIDAIAA